MPSLQQGDDSRVQPLRCVGLWMWIGLGCGLVDAAHVAVSRHLLDKLLHQPAGYIWMMPLSYLVVFGAVGAVHVLAAAAMPKLARLSVVMFSAVALTVFSVTLGFGWLGPIARLALAVGVGMVASRCATARPGAVLWLYRRTRLASVATLLLAAAAIPLFSALAESRHRSALPDPADGAPNVLMIVLDTVRADHLSAYGYERPTTPSIDRLAEAGVMFEWAISTAPWTLPSHVSMFTGLYPHEVEADWLVPMGDSYPTLAEVMSAHGYATAGFVGNLCYCAAENGLSRGFERYEDYYVEPAVIGTTSTLGRDVSRWTKYGDPFYTLLRNSAERITDRFLSWEAEQERPFFAFLNYFDAHAMYIAPEPFDRQFGPPGEHLYDFSSRGFRWSSWSAEEQQGFVDAYDGCLMYIDQAVGRLVRELGERGVLANTLILVVSDHGEMFGEHDMLDHGNGVYRPLLHVPLIFRFPGRLPEGERVTEFVSLVDLPSTILDLVGIRLDDPLPGHSLAPFWSGEAGPFESSPALSQINRRIRGDVDSPSPSDNLKSIYAEGLHYIVTSDGREGLFDARNDPSEERDLSATSPAMPRLRAALAEALRKD